MKNHTHILVIVAVTFVLTLVCLSMQDLRAADFTMGPMESNIDRMGSDYRNFDLSTADPNLCQASCGQDPTCQAWTYVKPNTIQGPRPRCWLKKAIPLRQSNNCCVSGIKVRSPLPNMGPVQTNFDRPGSDLIGFDLPAADYRLCRAECAGNPQCRAWTYVRPNTIQGPQPRCWLKKSIPQANQNTCCISGTKGVPID
jgi:PAN domain